MFRKYVIFTLAAFLVLGTNACTSKSATDESADVEQAGDEAIESAEATENNNDLSTEKGGAVADLGGDDLAPEEKLPGDTPQVTADNTLAPNDLSETPPADSLAQNNDPLPPPTPDAGAGSGAMDGGSPPPADMAAAPPGEPTPERAALDAPKSVGALRKIDTQPRKQGRQLLNAVYIARSGDSPESISQKVFASKDHVKELCKANSYNCSRPVKVGDKFYYNSPQRPTDDAVVKTFYEDAGIAPQLYTAKSGDNIRKVGKELLGNSRSWMELWATNPVESKSDLEEGAQLKYWPNTEAPAPTQTLAKTEEAAGAPGGEAPPPPVPDQAANMPPPDQQAPPPPPPPPPGQDAAQPPPPQQAANDSLPPAPDQNAAAAGSIEPPPPPPPPPPPADQAANHNAAAGADGVGAMGDQSQTFALGVGAVLLLAAAALFISIRKKRARRQIDFNTTTQTQIE